MGTHKREEGGLLWAFGNSKHAPSYTLPLKRPRLLIFLLLSNVSTPVPHTLSIPIQEPMGGHILIQTTTVVLIPANHLVTSSIVNSKEERLEAGKFLAQPACHLYPGCCELGSK